MKKPFLFILCFLSAVSLAFAWGSWGHQHINHAAVFALPDTLRRFFYNHIDYITEEAVGPDIRKYTINDRAEFPRHYINLEVFGIRHMDSLSSDQQELKSQFPDSIIQKAGILPWYILQMEDKLTRSFQSGRKSEILFLAADLAHYIGDANMPLHTSVNHDGQFTNQKGIHAFFEGQLPELFGKQYNLYTGDAIYIPDLKKETWSMIQLSFDKADTLLAVERKLRESFQNDRIYRLDSAGKSLKNKFNDPVHSYEYARQYHQQLNGMVERQIRNAIREVANYWYTAWINAGKPDLSSLDPESLTKKNELDLRKDIQLWKQGKVNGFKSEDEFPQ